MDDLTNPQPNWRHKLIALIGLALSTLFLLNLTFGVVEIPDNLPIIGNIDEVLASGVFFACLSQLGINLLPFYRALQTHPHPPARSDQPPSARLPG